MPEPITNVVQLFGYDLEIKAFKEKNSFFVELAILPNEHGKTIGAEPINIGSDYFNSWKGATDFQERLVNVIKGIDAQANGKPTAKDNPLRLLIEGLLDLARHTTLRK